MMPGDLFVRRTNLLNVKYEFVLAHYVEHNEKHGLRMVKLLVMNNHGIHVRSLITCDVKVLFDVRGLA